MFSVYRTLALKRRVIDGASGKGNAGGVAVACEQSSILVLFGQNSN